MKKYSDLEYLKLSKWNKFLYKLASFFASIPVAIGNFFLKIGRFFKNLGLAVANGFADLVSTFKNGDYKTRVSYVIMGFGSVMRGQVLRGLLFFLFENDITEKQKNFSLSDFFSFCFTSLSERMQQSCIMKQNCSEKCSQTSELMN